MIGDMIAKVRIEQDMTKTELARLTGINIGHLTHIEKSERNPSHKALKNICKALKIPYQQLMYTYDKVIAEDQEVYGDVRTISPNKVPAVTVNSFIDCPTDMPSSNFAMEVEDDSMAPSFKKGDYVFIERNTLLSDKECGLFSLNEKIFIRDFYFKKGKFTLKAKNKDFEDISVEDDDEFYIIGKVLGK